ncbi:MAG: NUDIX hydrolase [Polyangiales bacterium]
MGSPTPRFCGQCGSPLVERLIESEQRTRLVCSQCGDIAYRSPHVVVTTIVAQGSRVLLCHRATAPAAGTWGLPGGFLECAETLEEGAARETWEETGVRLDPNTLRLHALSTLPDLDEVYVGFLVQLSEADEVRLVCGAEHTEVRFFEEAEVPWTSIAYPEVGAYLQLYFRERVDNDFGIHFARLNSQGSYRKSHRVSAIEETHVLRDAYFGAASAKRPR